MNEGSLRPDLSRRSFVQTLGGLLAGGMMGALRAAEAPAAKPNVVIVIADDLNRSDVSCYGGRNVQTANIDRVAAEGVRFDYAFTATAMCAPMRMQLYTALYPVRNGAYPNHSRVKDGTRSVVHYLRDLGYRVGLIGKTHFGPRDSFPFTMVKGKMAPGGDWSGVEGFVAKDRKQPFCLVVCSHEPHLPWNKGDASALDPAKLRLPPLYVDTPATREALCRYYAEVKYFDEQVGDVVKLIDAAGLRDTTLLMVLTEQGAQLPGGKWTCYRPGLHVGIVARWPGKVKPASVSKAMIAYVDVVPTLIEAAGGKPSPDLDGRSFLPVLLGTTDEHSTYAYGVHTSGHAAAPKEGYPVRSIRTRDVKYLMNLNHKVEYTNVLTTGDKEKYWKSWVERAKTDPKARKLVDRYTRRPPEELYDLAKDPFELNNLADDPAYAKTKAELRAKLLEWMESQGDRGMETELAARKGGRKKRKPR